MLLNSELNDVGIAFQIDSLCLDIADYSNVQEFCRRDRTQQLWPAMVGEESETVETVCETVFSA